MSSSITLEIASNAFLARLIIPLTSGSLCSGAIMSGAGVAGPIISSLAGSSAACITSYLIGSFIRWAIHRYFNQAAKRTTPKYFEYIGLMEFVNALCGGAAFMLGFAKIKPLRAAMISAIVILGKHLYILYTTLPL